MIKPKTFLLILSDLLMFNLAFYLAFKFRQGMGFLSFNQTIAVYFNLLIFTNIVLLIVFGFARLYGEKRGLFDADEFWQVLVALIFCFLIVAAATFIEKSTGPSRIVVTTAFAFALFLTVFSRFSLRKIYAKTGFNIKQAAIIGKDEKAQAIGKKIKEHPELGYHLACFIDENNISDLSGFDTVFIAAHLSHEQIINLGAKYRNIELKIVPDMLEIIAEPLSFDEFKDIPLITWKQSANQRAYLRAKRIIDVFASAFLLILLSLLFLIVSALVKLSSKGDVFFSQPRVGKNGKIFMFHKFRTMTEDAERKKFEIQKLNEVDGLFKIKNDPRTTWLGRILRRTCLDELPQLWNVFKGDMSLVGPRPHIPEEKTQFNGWKSIRFNVKPGMTGLWQVSGRHDLMFEKAVLLDIYYIQHRSLLLDIEILAKTIPAIIFSKGRW
jgi:exopolysaccharide biosynthesis polyprenyl glycosylphosphotransferase